MFLKKIVNSTPSNRAQEHRLPSEGWRLGAKPGRLQRGPDWRSSQQLDRRRKQEIIAIVIIIVNS